MGAGAMAHGYRARRDEYRKVPAPEAQREQGSGDAGDGETARVRLQDGDEEHRHGYESRQLFEAHPHRDLLSSRRLPRQHFHEVAASDAIALQERLSIP
jgi:hypothetical protein